MRGFKVILIIVLLGFIMIGCSDKSISEDYDEENLKSDALEVVNMLCEGKYGEIVKNMSSTMQEQIDDKKLETVWEPIEDKLGEFKEVSKEVITEKDGLAIVGLVGDFENGKAQFTITFNKEGVLEGLYIK